MITDCNLAFQMVWKLRICSCLACVYRVMDARGKFGEHEKFLKRTKKVNKRPYWLVKNTPHFILWFVWEHLIQSTDNCEWKVKIYEENGENQSQMNSSVTEKCFKSQRPEFIKGFDCLKSCFRCRARCNWRSQTAGNLLVGSGPKRSMLIEKLRSSSLVSSIFQREGRLPCSLTGRKLWSKVKKMLTSSYLRTAQ